MKVRYSVEAFALAFVLYTTGLETALAAAAIIVAGTVLGDTLAGMTGKTAAGAIAFIATSVALIFGLPGLKTDYLAASLVGMLVGKHVFDGVEDASAGEILKQNYLALAVMAVVAAVREFLGSGAVFGYDVWENAVVSSAYLRNSFGLIFGGLGIAAVNTMIQKEISSDSIWIAVPAAVAAVGAVVGGDTMVTVKTVISAVIGVTLLISVRGKMKFSTPGKRFAGLPVEMISLGFLTMMLSVIA
ncbi:MAG: hypothetical protein HFI38_04030 [Lachnospiraceae bacterium]|jgi:hypothetical protein|nr:hypothetical protein [Lachnospiraceae bacterium]